MSTRILVADETGPDFRAALEQRLSHRSHPVELTSVDVGGNADALVVGGWRPERDLEVGLDAGVRWVQALTTGVDHVLTATVLESEVIVTNSAGATAKPVAEFAFARILEHAKQLRRLSQQQEDHAWDTQWLGCLAGARLVVVGLGSVGRRIAEIGRAFDMHVVGVRRRPDAGPGPCDEVCGPGDLVDAIGAADYVVLVPALTDDTRRLVGATELDALRPESLLVNVGRGELIDHDALLERARSGHFQAALDVFDEEPLPSESPLWDCPGIRVSPHNAALTPPLVEFLADLVADNIGRFVTGKPLQHVVDKSLGYPTT